MAWQIVKREDRFQGSDKPFVSISSDHISFNAMFTRLAEIGPEKRVIVHIDQETRRLGFEFIPDDRPDSFALSRASSDKKGKKRTGLFCSAGVLRDHPWIRSISKLPIPDRRFYNPRKEGQMWVIQLCPAFEERKARESANIPSDANGIYRYIREDGEIVYIGRGNIKKRLSSPNRQEWDFDIVEYSIITDPDLQIKWEEYWIQRFSKENGRLPFYNKISGFSTESD
jgi:hypothetical protein